VIATMFGQPVAVALAMARQIAKSSAFTEATRSVGALTRHVATAIACH